MDRILNLTIGVTNESWPLKQPITNYYHLCGYYKGPPVSAQWISINCSQPIPPSRFVVVHHGVPDGNLCICEILVFGSSFLNCWSRFWFKVYQRVTCHQLDPTLIRAFFKHPSFNLYSCAFDWNRTERISKCWHHFQTQILMSSCI